MKTPPPIPPIKIIRCPTAYAAPSTATITPTHAAAIRVHSDALEARRAAKAGPVPFSFGKRPKAVRNLFPRPKRDYNPDVMADVPDWQ